MQEEKSGSDANPVDDGDEDDSFLGIRDLRAWDLSGPQAENTLSLMLDDESSSVKLKNTNEVRWYDRVDFPSEFVTSAATFYRNLSEACDNDGDNDYLIDDKYFDSSSKVADVPNEFRNFVGEGCTAIVAGFFHFDTAWPSDEFTAKQKTCDECTLAVMAAFDRDHPEVFWLNGFTLTFYDIERAGSGYKATQYLIIGGFQNLGNYGKESLRIDCFESASEIRRAIEIREKRTQELLAAVGVAYSSSQSGTELPEVSVPNVYYSAPERVRFFNKWLTCSNAYSKVPFSSLSSEYPLAFECISALVGQVNTKGPVCEAYSRALKVLCDACGIPCVLVDGLGDGGAHMWNSVCIDDKWYAVDVTWNDPSGPIVPRSGHETERYLLVGADTKPGNVSTASTFSQSHIVQNRHYAGGLEFVNGPVIETSAYPSTGMWTFEDFDESKWAEVDLDFLDRKMKYAQISAMPSYEYTGRAKTPIPSSVIIGGKTLILGVDYRLDYENNVKAGTAYMKVIGIGSYSGTKTVPFTITRASVSISSITVPDVTYTGKALTPVPVIKIANTDFKPGTDYVVETNYANNKNAGLGAVSVVVRGIGSCEGATLRVLNFKIYPKKASLKKLTAKKKAMVVKWNKATSAWGTGYQIRYSTNSKFKSGVKNTNVKKVTTAQTTIKKLKSKKRYYVSIRVYKTVNGTKYYGAWSASKKIKVK